MAYWLLTGSDTGGAAQVAATHCPNERTLTLQSAARRTQLRPSQPHYGLHPAMFSGDDSLFFSSEYYLILIGNWYSFTYPGGMEGWGDLGPRWLVTHRNGPFTRPQTVTHPSTNRTRCRLTSLIKPTPLTIHHTAISDISDISDIGYKYRPMLTSRNNGRVMKRLTTVNLVPEWRHSKVMTHDTVR